MVLVALTTMTTAQGADADTAALRRALARDRDAEACATGTTLDAYVAARRAPAAIPALGDPRVEALGGLLIVEDDGSLTADNGGSVWDLEDVDLRFVPTPGAPGSFDATRTQPATLHPTAARPTAQWQDSFGQHVVSLPFSFPFGTATHDTLYVTSELGIFFAPQSESWFHDDQFAQWQLAGGEPRITPLLRDGLWDTWADRMQLYVETTPSSVTLTWHEQSSRPQSNPHMDRRFQVELHASGAIRMSYPDARSFNTFGAVQVLAPQGPDPLGIPLHDLSTLDATPTTLRDARQAFTFPTLLPHAVNDLVVSLYGLDDSNLDALAIYQNFYTEITFYAGAYHTNGRPGVDGIGNGGARRTSLLHMNHIDLSWNHRDDGSMVSVLNHELGHRWLYRVGGVGQSRSGAHPAMNAHMPAPHTWWTPWDSSSMGGTSWIDNGDGTFSTHPETTPYAYAGIDLYLMGLAAPAEVPDWWYVGGPAELLGPYWPPVDATYEGTRIDLSVEDVIAYEGPRDPAWPESQTAFDVAFVLVGRPEDPVTAADIANVRSKMALWAPTWQQTVLDRGTVRTEIPAIADASTPDCNFNGLADDEDLAAGAPDCDLDGIPDTCQDLPDIALIPHVTRVQAGGELGVDASVSNSGDAPQEVQVWIEAFAPDGTPWDDNPLAGPKTFSLQPGETRVRSLALPVPAYLPPSGLHTLQGSLGTFPDCVSRSAGFSFEVQ